MQTAADHRSTRFCLSIALSLLLHRLRVNVRVRTLPVVVRYNQNKVELNVDMLDPLTFRVVERLIRQALQGAAASSSAAASASSASSSSKSKSGGSSSSGGPKKRKNTDGETRPKKQRT